jgi:SAM-dependent methyltransferase
MDEPQDSGVRLKRGMRRAYDAAGRRYAQYIVPVFAPIATRVVELAAPGVDERHLDLATGSGALMRVAGGDGCSTHAVGVDLSGEMLRLARAAAPWARLLQADLERLPLKRSSIDVATLAFALHHLPDPHAALREISRILRLGGRLALAAWDDRHGPLWQLFDDWLERTGIGATRGTRQSERPIDTLHRLRAGLAQSGLSIGRAESAPTSFRFPDLAAYWDWRVSFPATYRAVTARDSATVERLREQFIAWVASQIGGGAVADDRNVLYALAFRR